MANGPWYASEEERRRVQELAERDRIAREGGPPPSKAGGFVKGLLHQLPAHAMGTLGFLKEPLPPDPRIAYASPEVRGKLYAQHAARTPDETVRTRYEDHLEGMSDEPGFTAGRVGGSLVGHGAEYLLAGGALRSVAKGLLPRINAVGKSVNLLGSTPSPRTAALLRSVVDPRTLAQGVGSDLGL